MPVEYRPLFELKNAQYSSLCMAIVVENLGPILDNFSIFFFFFFSSFSRILIFKISCWIFELSCSRLTFVVSIMIFFFLGRRRRRIIFLLLLLDKNKKLEFQVSRYNSFKTIYSFFARVFFLFPLRRKIPNWKTRLFSSVIAQYTYRISSQYNSEKPISSFRRPSPWLMICKRTIFFKCILSAQGKMPLLAFKDANFIWNIVKRVTSYIRIC